MTVFLRRVLVLSLVVANLALVQSLSLIPNRFTKQSKWQRLLPCQVRRPFLGGNSSPDEQVHVPRLAQRELGGRKNTKQQSVRSFPILRTVSLDTKALLSPPPGSKVQPRRKRRAASASWKQRLGLAAGLIVATLLWSSQPALASTSVAAAAAPVNLAPMLSRYDELRLMGRLWYAALLGALIGKERSTANHHPAGVRTLALVALGSSAFTLVSMYGFGPAGKFDTSRMASAVASGIGFIGAGVITTTTRNQESVVHGLTTAAAVWISAAVGVTCGSGLYILATSLGLASLGFLRIGGNVKHKRSYHRHPEKAIKEMVETDPDLLRKLIDWEKVYNSAHLADTSTSTYKLPEPPAPKKIVKIKRILQQDDESLISKRFFPSEKDETQEAASSNEKSYDYEHQGEHGDDDDYFHDDDDDELVIMSSRRSYANQTDFTGGEQQSAELSRGNRRLYDDDVGP